MISSILKNKIKESLRYNDPLLQLFKGNKSITVEQINKEQDDFRFWATKMKEFNMSEEEIKDIFSKATCADDIAEAVFKLKGDTPEYKAAFKEDFNSGVVIKKDAGNVEQNIASFNNATTIQGVGMAEELENPDEEAKITINIRDELNKLDQEEYRDLVNIYDAILLTKEQKEKLVDLILQKKEDEITKYLLDIYNFLWEYEEDEE